MATPEVLTWPFWAPSGLDAVEEALAVSDLAAGETLVDLGCGDGRVLVAAAERGARVIGVESDIELVELARIALRERGFEGEVVHGDLFDLDVVADVYFTYLAPATLQRALPGLAARRGTRLVTVDYDVPGLEVDLRSGAARLYRMPGRQRPRPTAAGWKSSGALVVAPPDHKSLTVLDLHHPGGEVVANLVGNIAPAASLLTGADEVDPLAHVAIDIRWGDHPSGTVRTGAVDVAGLDVLPIFVVFDAGAESATWELSAAGVQEVLHHLEACGWESDGASLVRAVGG